MVLIDLYPIERHDQIIFSLHLQGYSFLFDPSGHCLGIELLAGGTGGGMLSLYYPTHKYTKLRDGVEETLINLGRVKILKKWSDFEIHARIF